MSRWPDTTEESRSRWERNADYWDERMGESGNRFARELVIPHTERFLGVQEGERVLDIACGNGLFSRRLAQQGVRVTAFDYSHSMVANARRHCESYLDRIDFRVMDATAYDEIIALGRGSFDRAVCNMGIHDISDIVPLFRAVYEVLDSDGVFVLSVLHPCFGSPGMRRVVETEETGEGQIVTSSVQIFNYITPRSFEGIAIVDQPVAHIYYHRPISVLFEICLDAGFAIRGLAEPVFGEGKVDRSEIPPVMVVKLLKCSGSPTDP